VSGQRDREPEEERPGGSTHADLSGTSHDLVQAGNVNGGVHFHRAERGNGDSPTPRQLPRDTRGFVNRTDELRRLEASLTGSGACVVIAGTAGAGKTSLALRWAHQIEHRFPDGQLYINLRGYDPQEPIAAHEALHRFLTALGVPPQAVPADTEAAAGLYRSLLADRRMLVVLDNAATAAQVRPLLPGNADCLVIVTSRSRLSGLAIRDGAHRLTLGTLTEAEAVALLRAVTTGYRPEDDAARLVELARLCARLPLALRIAAERAASDPHLGLDELIADLRDESALWDTLSSGDEGETEAVRTVFAWSYRALPSEAARLFRLLGLHPGPDFGLGAAASLAGVTRRRARQLLNVLVGAHLLEQTAPERYEFHDLLRAYAADQAHDEEPADERGAALRRLLDWYLRAADAAQTWIVPANDRVPMEPPADGVEVPSFAEYDAAVDWSEREQPNILPAMRAAEAAGLDGHAWRLATVWWHAQAPSALATEWLAIGEIGLRAVQRVGDRAAEAGLLDNLGLGHKRLSQLPESQERHEEALSLWRELGDRAGEARSLNYLGLIQLRRRRLADAEERFEQAGAVFRELGERHKEFMALSNRGTTRYQATRLEEAAQDARRALSAHRELGVRGSVGNALRLLAAIALERGEVGEALRLVGEAVEIALDLRDQVLEGYWLITMGDVRRERGEWGEALECYQGSAVLHRRLGDRSREALAWQGAGSVYARLGRGGEAVAFFRRAAAVHREMGDGWGEAVALDGLAGVVEGDDAGRAREYRAEALRLVAAFDDPRAEAMRLRLRLAPPQQP
jgi:tetratricopeptide (TPR) repeat protein